MIVTADFSPECMKVLQKASAKMDGRPVLYATEYGRPDNRLRNTSTAAMVEYAFDNALKAASKALGSGIPTDGWIAVTDEGMGVFTRRLGGIGTHKGTIPNHLIASVSVQHHKKPGKATIDIVFADQSAVSMFTKTKATYEALSPWVQSRIAGSTSPLEGPGSKAPDAPPAPLFDANAIYEMNPGLSNSH